MRVQLQPFGMQRLGVLNEETPTALALLRRIDVQAVNVAALHGEVRNDAVASRPNPHRTRRGNMLCEDLRRVLPRERLPCREERVPLPPGPVPDPNHLGQVAGLKGAYPVHGYSRSTRRSGSPR